MRIQAAPTMMAFSVIAFVTAGTAFGQPFSFTRIVDTQTPIPGGTGNFATGTAFGQIAFSQGRAVFQGVDAFGAVGVYEFHSGSLSLVANSSTPIPGGSGTFASAQFIAPGVAASGDNLTFYGANASASRGIYSRFGGSLGVVVTASTPLPGGGTPSGGFGAYSLEGKNVAFKVLKQTGSQPAIYRSDNGSLSLVADSTTPVPGGTGNFKNFDDQFLQVALNAGIVTFRGVDSASKPGIYRQSGPGIARVFDTNSDAPAGQGKFTDFGAVLPDGADLGFGGRAVSGPVKGALYKMVGGVLSMAVSFDDPAPGGGSYNTIADHSVAFADNSFVYWDLGTSNLFTDFGGTPQRVLGVGDILDGKTVSQVRFDSVGRDHNQLAIYVKFSDDNSAHRDQAIYLVNLPAPGSALSMGVAGFCAWGRRRR